MGVWKEHEHYISEFIIKNFADKNGKVRAINKKVHPLKVYSPLPETLFAWRNLYETKNKDATYFQRNVIENTFGDFENKASKKLPQILIQADQGQKLQPQQIEFLANLVAFQLIRLPFIRNFLFECNSNILDDSERELQTNAMYRFIIDSPESGFEYLENNDFALSDEGKDEVRKTNANTTAYDFVKNECNTFLIKAEENAFCIGDNPILINQFTNARFIYPISSRYAIVCSLTEPNDIEEYDTIRYVTKDMVSEINEKIIRQAKRIIVFSHLDEAYMVDEVRKALE